MIQIKGLKFTTKAEGPGRGWWGPPKGTHISHNVSGIGAIETYIDHGPQGLYRGKPVYTPGKNTITRVDKNALVSLDTLLDLKKVDIVRQVGEERVRRPGYIQELANNIRREGFDPKQAVTLAVEFNGKITIIDGTHRIAAARLAGLKAVPCEVRYFGLSDTKYLLDYLNK